MPNNSRADMVRLLAERYDTKSNVKLVGFRFKRPTCLATLKSCDATNQLSVDDNIYIYIYIYVCVCVCVCVLTLLVLWR